MDKGWSKKDTSHAKGKSKVTSTKSKRYGKKKSSSTVVSEEEEGDHLERDTPESEDPVANILPKVADKGATSIKQCSAPEEQTPGDVNALSLTSIDLNAENVVNWVMLETSITNLLTGCGRQSTDGRRFDFNINERHKKHFKAT
jgi:hypothetical protein